MSTLKELLKDVPVEWKPLGELAVLKRGTTITAKSKTDGIYPVISGGQKPAYFNGEYNREGETITIAGSGAYAGHVLFWNEPIFVSDAFSVKPDLTLLNTRYVYFILLSNQDWIYNLKKGVGVPHVYPKDVAHLSIPIPHPNDPEKSLAIQQEIVRVLDGLSEQNKALTTALAQEIDQRKKQYEYYREELFRFEGKEVEWKKLKEISTFSNGKGHEKVISENGEYIVVNSKFISTEGKVIKRSNQQLSPVEKDDILIVMSDLPNGRALAKTFIVDDENKYTLNQRIGRIRVHANQRILPSFLNFLLNRNVQLLKYDNGIDQTNLKKGDIENLEVPIFLEKNDQVNSLMKQEHIVRLLDQFDEATKNIVAQLEKEIELRNKQYEYYRNLLLSFPKETN